MESKDTKHSIRKWNWKLTETINPMLSEKEISDLINKKLAYIIVELEHSPTSYINVEKSVQARCNNIDSAV